MSFEPPSSRETMWSISSVLPYLKSGNPYCFDGLLLGLRDEANRIRSKVGCTDATLRECAVISEPSQVSRRWFPRGARRYGIASGLLLKPCLRSERGRTALERLAPMPHEGEV